MKKIIFSLIFSLGLTSTLAAKVKVVTTLPDLAALVSAVGGERVEVASIAKGYQDPHFVDPKPSYILKLQSADLLFKIGLGLELWLDPLAIGARNAKLRVVDCSRGVPLLEIPTSVDRSLGDIHAYGNPHIWLDPANGKIMLDTIAATLARTDPSNAAFYETNRAAYEKRLDSALSVWQEKLKPYAGTKVITYHNSWPYFNKRFGLVAVDYVEPKPGISPSPAHLNELAGQMKREGVGLILMEPYFSEKDPNLVARLTGARVLKLASSVGAFKGTEDYLLLFDYNVNLLVGALKGKGERP
ncbi:MAG: metal ABC transporter substrate-binding protein [candidate division Zixibacteria bacterium]|nr:metal ABC transporter substrate-binding protein [candidate division Zixibacteria bacterium]MCI0595436.1 metal ABC transporter substrate-binding protein [candidate division Zixibacteria bacterium]